MVKITEVTGEIKKTGQHFIERISWKDISGILVGSIIIALAIQALLLPAKLLTGGLSGLAIIINFITGSKVWLWYLVLNIPVFVVGYRLVSFRFIFYSILGALFLSGFLALFSYFDFDFGLADDVVLSALFGGVMAGVGSGIVFRCKGSLGGTDIIAVIFRRFKGYNIGQTFFAVNSIIIALSAITTTIELALYSAISIWISSQVVDMVESGPNVTRTAMIISDNNEEISRAIIHVLKRGCTSLNAKGVYTGEDKPLLMATVSKTQLPRLKEIVFDIDPAAFIMINETIEVYGQGFKERYNEL